MEIIYDLKGGKWDLKNEVKEKFYFDLYAFVNRKYDTELKNIEFEDFVDFEPYVIGNLCGQYFVEEKVGGSLEEQSEEFFIGYCFKQGKYLKLIPHLITFFANWRRIEGCSEKNASDFFANSWASLVDTAKFFKYTTIEELEKSPESPTVRCDIILNSLQSCPETTPIPFSVALGEEVILPRPRRINYTFVDWFTEKTHKFVKTLTGEKQKSISLYAKWKTNTFLHSNDGYITFDDLYTDFLKDFSTFLGEEVTKDSKRVESHGPVSDFCVKSFGGKLDAFFAIPKYYQKWIWLINYLCDMKKMDDKMKQKFQYQDHHFGCEAQVRWELNSLFVKRFHLVWPKTGDYSGAGIHAKIADFTNSQILNFKYIASERCILPKLELNNKCFKGWYDNPEGKGESIESIDDERFAGKSLYAQYK